MCSGGCTRVESLNRPIGLRRLLSRLSTVSGSTGCRTARKPEEIECRSSLRFVRKRIGAAMELDKLSLELERSLQEARDFAEKRVEKYITPKHLLYVMLDQRGVLRAFAERHGAQPQLILDYLSAKSSDDDRRTRLEPGERAIAGPALREQIDRAFQVAEKRRSQLVEAIDVLMAVLEEGEG